MLNIFTNSPVGDQLPLTTWGSNKMRPVLKRFLLLWQGGIPFSFGGLTCSLRLFNSFPDLCPLVEDHTSDLLGGVAASLAASICLEVQKVR